MNPKTRKEIIVAVDTAVESGARLLRACESISICERRLRRWRKKEDDGRKGCYHAKNQKLSEREKDQIMEALAQPEIENLSLKAACATLMDKGFYYASPSSFARVVKERAHRKERRGAASRGKKPLLKATAPNQVWCWDITWLETPHMGRYFYLYMVMDLFSRKVVAWEVYAKEDGTLARDLIAKAMEEEKINPNQLTIHADNGRPMRSMSLRQLFDLMSVNASYSRPHTSNDNAYAESLFNTFKSRISFPEYFKSREDANDFCMEFFTWYNGIHMHSGLDYVPPLTVHEGRHHAVFENRNRLLNLNREMNPTRHGGRQKIFKMEKEVELKHRTKMTQVS